MVFKAQKIADALVLLAIQENIGITNMHLQTLLYYSQVLYYAKAGWFLFEEEMEKWKHGIVVPDVFYRYNRNSVCGQPLLFSLDREALKHFSDETLEFLSIIVKKAGPRNVWDLLQKVHKELPWDYTARGNIVRKQYLAQFANQLKT